MYVKGLGVPQDYKTAVKWYRLAAEQGHAKSQTNLGTMYGKGVGVEQSHVYAAMWTAIAGSNGDDRGKELFEIIRARYLSPKEIKAVEQLARECVKKNYKGC